MLGHGEKTKEECERKSRPCTRGKEEEGREVKGEILPLVKDVGLG